MSSSGYTCVRYIFCYVNVLLWLSGCGILGVGVWLRVLHEGYATLIPQYSFLSADILLIIVGATTVVVTFFACCGSWFQSRCMLVTQLQGKSEAFYLLHYFLAFQVYALFWHLFGGYHYIWHASLPHEMPKKLQETNWYFSLVIVMFLIEFIVATLAFIYREDLNYVIKDELLDGIKYHYRNSTESGLEVIWSRIHTKFHCCGINDYLDWYEIDAWKDRKIVPVSCCLPEYQNMTGCWEEGNYTKWYKKGCSEQLLMWFVGQLHIVGVVGLLVSFIQLFGLISAMLLFCTVQHKRVKGHVYKAYSAYPS